MLATIHLMLGEPQNTRSASAAPANTGESRANLRDLATCEFEELTAGLAIPGGVHNHLSLQPGQVYQLQEVIAIAFDGIAAAGFTGHQRRRECIREDHAARREQAIRFRQEECRFRRVRVCEYAE